MRILFSVSHPAHVHLFKNTIWKLQDHKHEVLICAREKEVTIDLLKRYGFSYTVVSETNPSRMHLLTEQIQRTIRFMRISSKFKPDLSISTMDPSLALASRLMGIPYICLADTEHSWASIYGALPFTKAVLTPSCFKKKMGSKQICYNGCHQLASLHPNYFTPNPAVLTELGLNENDNIFLIRFAAFNTSHDTKSEHFNRNYIGKLINVLEEKGKIVISSEVKLGPSLLKYQYKLSPEKYHDLLYYSSMYVGEGSTSALEAAVLGTPAINFERITIKGKQYSFADFNGVIAEFQDKYHLIHCYYDEEKMLEKIDEYIDLGLDRVKMQAKKNKERLLKDTIDVTKFMVWFIENYPESFTQMRDNPEIQNQFSTQS